MKYVSLFFAFGLMGYAGVSQHLNIDTKAIEPLIREWNYANNARSVESFQKVYSDRLLYYTERLTELKAIERKQNLYKTNPDFRQRIVSDIRYTPYTSGIVKCDFTKEVREDLRWRSYPSYLLVSYEDNRYRIVGESDYSTDRKLRYQPDIGAPIQFQKSASTDSGTLANENRTEEEADVVAEKVPETTDDKPDSSRPATSSLRDSSLALIAPPLTTDVDSAVTKEHSEIATPEFSDQFPFFPPLSSMGMVTIPKGYVFLLIGILGIGGLMIFIADSVQTRGRRKRRRLLESDEVDHVIRDFKLQSVFEMFVITLFDPLFFQHRRPKAERVYAGKVSEGETVPDFEFDFNHKSTHTRFAIKCLYYKNTGARELHLYPHGRRNAFTNFEEDRGMDLYYVIGIGGTPDDPKELYLVPSNAIRSEYISRAALRPYSKSGMFFYNSAAQSLQ